MARYAAGPGHRLFRHSRAATHQLSLDVQVPKVRRCLQRRVRLLFPCALASGWLEASTESKARKQKRPAREAGELDRQEQVDLDIAQDARSRLASASQLVRDAASFVNHSVEVKLHAEATSTTEGAAVDVDRVTKEGEAKTMEADATDACHGRRKHPLSLTPSQMETERRAKAVFPGSMVVSNQSLAHWRLNEDPEIEEEARKVEEKRQEEELVQKAREIDWNTIRMEADVGNVKAQLGWVRHFMKAGVLEGRILDPLSWRLAGSDPKSLTPEHKRMAAFLPELSPAAVRRFRQEWHPGSPTYEAVAQGLQKFKGGQGGGAGGRSSAKKDSSSGGCMSDESSGAQDESDESDESVQEEPWERTGLRGQGRSAAAGEAGGIGAYAPEQAERGRIALERRSLVYPDLKYGPKCGFRLRGGAGENYLSGNRNPGLGMRSSHELSRGRPTSAGSNGAGAQDRSSKTPPDASGEGGSGEDGFMFTGDNLPWGAGRERWHAPIPRDDVLKRQFVAELHEEDISPLNLTLAERQSEAAKWLVLLDPCTDEVYYANEETCETRWNLPRGLRYVDLHDRGRTAHLCHLVVPDHLSPSVRNVEWERLIQQGRATGEWTEYREQRGAYMDEVRATLLGAAPYTRIYIRLAQPHCFEGQVVCDPPHEIDPGMLPGMLLIQFCLPCQECVVLRGMGARNPYGREVDHPRAPVYSVDTIDLVLSLDCSPCAALALASERGGPEYTII